MVLRFLLFLNLLTPLLSHAQVDSALLSKESLERFKKVPEFKFIQEQANKMGLKVYLFGGTASAFGHYVRWDLEREGGDDKYQEERFDYDFTNIYRGNQDLDIVIDGTAEEAEAFKKILKKEYPHFVGSKEAWEVRLLRASIGDKQPLLESFDFLNQHTDTNSTGMIALNPDRGEIVYRDLFDWENTDSQFLQDISSAEIKFIYSQTHDKTSRFQEGKNPPVFAALRYLAKLAQYEVKEAAGDFEIIQKMVQAADWEEIKTNSYVRHKLAEFAKKVLLNAPNSEYAWNLLDESGFKDKLIEMDGGQIDEMETLSWWMNKEPLRSKPLGKTGRRAAEIFKGHINGDGEIVVAHETNLFSSYENITRSSKGMANAFISRDGIKGELAIHGNGFYTMLGTKGGRGTNLTIRFTLNPEAKEGEDFIYIDKIVVILNKNALNLIQENLNMDTIDYLKLLDSGEVDASNKGLIEKFNRKFERLPLDSEEFREAVNFVHESNKLIEEVFGFQPDTPAIDSFDALVSAYLKRYTLPFEGGFEAFLRSKEGSFLTEKELNLVKTLIKNTQDPQKMLTYFLTDGRNLKPSGFALFLEDFFVEDDRRFFPILGDFSIRDVDIKALILDSEIQESEMEMIISHLNNKDVDRVKSSESEYFLDFIFELENPDIIVEFIKSLVSESVDLSLQNRRSVRKIDKRLLSEKHIKALRSFFKETAFEKAASALFEVLAHLGLFEEDLFQGALEQELFIAMHDKRKILEGDAKGKHKAIFEGLTVLVNEQGKAQEALNIFAEKYKNYSPHKDAMFGLADFLLNIYSFDGSEPVVERILEEIFLNAEKTPNVYSLMNHKYFKAESLLKNKFLQKLFTSAFMCKTCKRSDYLKLPILEEGRASLPFIPDILDRLHEANPEENSAIILNFLMNYEASVRTPHLLQQLILDGFKFDRYIIEINGPFEEVSWDAGSPRNKIELISKGSGETFLSKTCYETDFNKCFHKSIKRDNISDELLAKMIFSDKKWGKYPHLLKLLINKNTVNKVIIKDVLSKEHFSNSPELVETLIDMGAFNRSIVKHVLSKTYWQKHEGLISKILDAGDADDLIFKHILSQGPGGFHPDIIKRLIERGGNDHYLAKHLFSKMSITDNLELIRSLIISEEAGYYVSRYIGTRDDFIDEGLSLLPPLLHSEESLDSFLDHYVFSNPKWQESGLVKSYLKGEELTSSSLRTVMNERSFEDWHEDFLKESPSKKMGLSCGAML